MCKTQKPNTSLFNKGEIGKLALLPKGFGAQIWWIVQIMRARVPDLNYLEYPKTKMMYHDQYFLAMWLKRVRLLLESLVGYLVEFLVFYSTSSKFTFCLFIHLSCTIAK